MLIPLVVIAGPTASGKTALAIDIAKELGGEIISADSMQIYREMNIGTAKPTAEEMCGVPHHMLDIADPCENFSLWKFARAAHKAINDVYSRGKLPILAGGTGLYTDTIVHNIELSEAGGDNSVREELMKKARSGGAAELYKKLSETDPESDAKLCEKDVKRVVRALEIYYLTGKTKSENDEISKKSKKIYNYLYFAIETEREILYNRINTRVDEMVKRGLFEEVSDIKNKYGFINTTAMQGIGYREVLYYLRGLVTRTETEELIKRNTRRLAKRQMTWLRKNDEVIWIKPGDRAFCTELIREKLGVEGC